MTQTSPTELLSVAQRIAERAGEEARTTLVDLTGGVYRRAGAHLGERTKTSETDPVTIVDTGVETFVRSELDRLRPGDAVLGEEEGLSEGAHTEVRWIVDPVDGTVNLLFGLPFSAVSIAAEVSGTVVAGVVHNIFTGETFTAERGAGAQVRTPDGVTSAVVASSCTRVDRALVATGFSYDATVRAEQGELVARILPRVADIRRFGAAAIDLCYLAAGRVDAFYERDLKPWDYAAGALVAEEAGAWVSTSDDPLVPTIAVAPGIADEFRALISG